MRRRPRTVSADADAFRPHPVDHLRDRVRDRAGHNGFRLHAGPGAAWTRTNHGHPAGARHRRALPVLQRDLPGHRGGQGHRHPPDARRRRGDDVAEDFPEDPRRPGGQGAQRVRGRRAVRRPAAAHRQRSLPARRGGDRRRSLRAAATRRPHARPDERPGRQHPHRQAHRPARRILQGAQRHRPRPGFVVRLLGPAGGRPQRRRGKRPDTD